MTTFTLGVNTCFAVKRWPEPDRWAAIVREHLGLDLVQHSLDLVDLDPYAPASDLVRQATAVRAACERYDLRLHSTVTGLAAYSSNLLLHPDPAARQRALRWYRTVIDFTAEAGARVTGGHLGAFSVDDFADPARRADLSTDFGEAIEELTAYARERGLEALLVENMAAAREPSASGDIRALVRPGDTGHVPLLLCLDIGHHCVPGTSGAERDPYVWLAAFGATAGVIHLQQSDAGGDHHWPFTIDHNSVGRIDAERVLRTIEATGRDHVPLVLEVLPPFEQDDGAVLDDLARSCHYWQHHLTEHGRVAAS